MNYYNPYMTMMPLANTGVRTGLFSRLFRNGFSFSSLLSGTQRTLNFVNQAIPAIKQISPMVKNAKTMFKVMSEFKKGDNVKKNTNIKAAKSNNINKSDTTPKNYNYEEKNNAPTFFI